MKKAIVVLALLLVLILGCAQEEIQRVGWKLVEIQQDVKICSVLKDTYYVTTNVWVRNFWGYAISLEFSDVNSVPKDRIGIEKALQMVKAKEVYTQVIKKLREH
jgi:hypothetical protein